MICKPSRLAAGVNAPPVLWPVEPPVTTSMRRAPSALASAASAAPWSSSVGKRRAKLRTPVGYSDAGNPLGVVGPLRVRSVTLAVGEITASGPPGAEFVGGMSLSAQPELRGPMTASTAEVRAYACPLLAQRFGSNGYEDALQSSQAR